MRLMTWNVWFDKHGVRYRMDAIAEQVLELRPDVLAFQELNVPNSLYLEDRLSEHYVRYESNPTLVAPSGYWEGFYVRKEQVRNDGHLHTYLDGRRMKFRASDMGRGVTFLSLPGIELATSHLESLNAPDARALQAKQTFEVLNANPRKHECTQVFLGDMNLLNGQELKLPYGWVDAWTEIHPTKPGFTYDSKANSMLDDNYQDRLDRVYVNPRHHRIAAIWLVGTQPIGILDGRALYPSDHFGLVVDLERVTT